MCGWDCHSWTRGGVPVLWCVVVRSFIWWDEMGFHHDLYCRLGENCSEHSGDIDVDKREEVSQSWQGDKMIGGHFTPFDFLLWFDDSEGWKRGISMRSTRSACCAVTFQVQLPSSYHVIIFSLCGLMKWIGEGVCMWRDHHTGSNECDVPFHVIFLHSLRSCHLWRYLMM